MTESATPRPLPRTVKELRALYRISQAVGASLELTEAVEPVLRILAEELGMQRGTLALVEPGTGELVIEVAHGLTPAEIRRGRYRVGEGVMGRVLERGEPMVIPSIGAEPLFLDRTGARAGLDRSRVAFLCVPVKVAGETVGVLSADRLPAVGDELEDDLRVLQVVAALVAQAVRTQQRLRSDRRALEEENRRLREAFQERYGPPAWVGESPARAAVWDQVRFAARGRSPALITGAPGTGRGFVARAIHAASALPGPFVEVPCARREPGDLERALFGPGGAAEQAAGGTLYLKDVESLPADLQAVLLRLLRAGNPRVVASAGPELAEAVRRGAFRDDLYRRLAALPIHLPSLAEAKADVVPLARALLARVAGPGARFSEEAEAALRSRAWPGNVAELEGVVREAAARAGGGEVGAEHVDGPGRDAVPAGSAEEVLGRWVEELLDRPPPEGVYRALVDRLDRIAVARALNRAGGVRIRAAELLGINRNTLYAKLDRMNRT
ncbi:sigma 54-interacting transcriptional regulator [Deferrisoma sp.]